MQAFWCCICNLYDNGWAKKGSTCFRAKKITANFHCEISIFAKILFWATPIFSAHPLGCGPKGVQLMAADVHTNVEVIELSANCVICSQ